MRTRTRIAAGLFAASAGMATMASPAFADTSGSDGLNLINDNNANVLPIQACGNDIPVLIGVVVPIASPEQTNCNGNGPLQDHPKSEKDVEVQGHHANGGADKAAHHAGR